MRSITKPLARLALVIVALAAPSFWLPRSRQEFETLLSSASYRLERIMPLPQFLNLIEAVRM